MKNIKLIILLFLFFISCKEKNNSVSISLKNNSVPTLDYEVSGYHPHDTTSFTEGFLVYKGDLYESTGATEDLPQTKSLFGVVELKTGKIQTKVEIDKIKYFGEGITFLNGKIYQLTYKTKIGFVYDVNSFKKIGDFIFPSNEGWGLSNDGKNLIMSDGTNVLTYLNPNDFKVVKTISVTENNIAQQNLNELEYINGYIYANIYTTNQIVKINPQNGNIIGKIDVTSLANEVKNIYPNSLETNGIAFDSISDRIYITGKLWPKIYEIKFKH